MFDYIKSDAKRIFEYSNHGRIKNFLICISSQGFRAILVYRFGNWLDKQNIFFKFFLYGIYVWCNFRIKKNWGIEIPKKTKIGKGFYIGHFGGIVLSSDCVIGDYVSISQQVTIGIAGKGLNRGCPVIEDGVYIAPGAKIFGKIVVGKNSKIGANVVLYKNIPPNSKVVLEPGFKILN